MEIAMNKRMVLVGLVPALLIALIFSSIFLMKGANTTIYDLFSIFPYVFFIILISVLGYYVNKRRRKKNDNALSGRLERLDDFDDNK